MKHLEKILRAFRKEKEEPTEYSLEKLAALLEEEGKKEKNAAGLEAEPILKDIRRNIDRIKALALDIKDKESPQEINARVKTVLRTAKPEYVREVLEALNAVGDERRKDLSAEKRAIDETLDLLAKAMIGPGKYLPMAYGDDLDRIKKELKTISLKRKELEKIACINDDAADLLKEIHSLRERISHVSLLEKEKDETARNMEELEKEKISLTEESEKIEKGREYAEFLGKKGKLEKVKCEKEEKENKVYNLLTPLKRPLKMLRKSLEEKGNPGAFPKEIEKYAENPVDTLCSSDAKELTRTLSDLKKSIETSQEIKDEEKNRVKQRVSAIEREDMQKLRYEIISLRKQEQDITDELGSAQVLAKKTSKEKEIERMLREIAQKKEDLARIEKKIGKEVILVETEKQALEEKTGRLKNKRIIITLE